MKKISMVAASLMAAMTVCGQSKKNTNDSIKLVKLDEVEVISTRATKTTPVAFMNIDKKDLKKVNFGKDLPAILQMTPSVVATSDAGAGIGYSQLRVRGTDPSRINITANGIPVNDAESHSVFWVNMSDFASSVKDIQIQRGVGTSTNGAGAFGASINLKTADFHAQPYADLNFSYGSFNTHKENIMVGTGLINGHWSFDARLSDIGSDGYLDRASTSLNSYYLQGGYFNDNTSVRLITFANKEKTYHAWNYPTRAQLDAFGRRFNSCGYMYTTDKDGNIHHLSVDYDLPKVEEMVKEGGKLHYYDNQTDNYIQKHYQLLVNHSFNNAWNVNLGLHYTKGDGYYQEYKQNRKFREFNLQPYMYNGKEVKKSDLIRKKEMDNWFGGGVFALNYKSSGINASLGGGLNRYDGDHFGKILWIRNYIGELDPDKDYYRNNGSKNDANLYLKGDFQLTKALSVYADMQYRHITYKIYGPNDKWDKVNKQLQMMNVDENFNFFNPKFGFFWKPGKNHSAFASLSVAHREPTRDNYRNSKEGHYPTSERLMDYELGYNLDLANYHFGATLYYMDYKDQLIPTGELNDTGAAMSINVPKSYRMGIELISALRMPCGFRWEASATFSKNRIKDFVETLYGRDDNWADLPAVTVNHGNTHIAFSPEVILNNNLGYTWKNFDISLQTQYVGRQYMSNMDAKEHELKAYCVSNLDLSYNFKLPRTKNVNVGLTVYNLFDKKYESFGWASRNYVNKPENVESLTGYSVQAGTNLLAHLSLSF